MDQVAETCAARGLRLTPVRRRALEVLLESHRAVGAYDLLKRLDADGLGSQPPVAYRALDFLVSNGFAHKVESLNAFVACADPVAHADPDQSAAFLICRDCGTVGESIAASHAKSVADAASSTGFAVETAVVEVEGTCQNCYNAKAGQETP
jgi:Fur family zinc uptake transcriptional regulator